MSDLNLLLCCPRCGGESGYYYARTEKYTVNGSWSGDENANYENEPVETKPRCADCNKIIKAT